MTMSSDEQQESATEQNERVKVQDISPSDAVSVDGLKGVGRLRHHDVDNIVANWMVFNPETLIEVLETYHDDKAVMLTAYNRPMKSGVSAPVLLISDVLTDNTDLSVVTGQVGGKDADHHQRWRDENAE